MRKLRASIGVAAAVSLAFGWLAAAQPTRAAEPTIAPPAQGKHVVDTLSAISQTGLARIEEYATRIEAAGGGRIAIYTYDPMAGSPPSQLAASWNVDGLLMTSRGDWGDKVIGPRLEGRLTKEQLEAVDGYGQYDAPNAEAWFLSMLARIDGFLAGSRVFDGAGVLDAAGTHRAEKSARDLADKLGVPVYVDIASSGTKSPSTLAFFNGAHLASDFDTALIVAIAVGDANFGGFVNTNNSDIWNSYDENEPWKGSSIEDRPFTGLGRQSDVLAAIDAVQKSPLIPPDAIPWIIFTIVIVVFSVALPLGFGARLMYKLAGATPPIKNGRTGDAVIESIAETGVTVTMPSVGPEAPEYKFGLQVTPDDGSPSYHVDTRVIVPRIFVPMMLPGRHVAVTIDPKDPQRLNIDFDNSGHRLAAAGAGGLAYAGASPGGASTMEFGFDQSGRPLPGEVASMIGAVRSGALPTIKGSADQLLATGTHGTATITTVQPLGKKVRDVNPSAPAERLDDPIWVFTVMVKLPGQNEFPAVFGHRVPLAKLADLGPGTRLTVAVDEADKNQEVAIDWDKSPLAVN